jgi:hypothetical protein
MSSFKILNLIFFITISFFYLDCSESSHRIELTKINDINLNNLPEDAFFIEYIISNENEYLVALNKNIPAFNFFNIESGNIDHSIPLNNIAGYSIPWYSTEFIGTDSCLIINSRINQITLLNNKGTILNEWRFADENTYTFGTTPYMPFKLFKNRIYCNSIRNDIRINTIENLREYYSSPTNVILELNSDTLKPNTYFGEFPPSYKDQTKNYNDFLPCAAYNEKGETILSFGSDHNLYVYDSYGKFIREISGKSKYIDEFNEMDIEKESDYAFLKKYLAVEPKYLKFIYDPYSKMYYRIAKHKINNYENKDGTVKSSLDGNYSIIFFDSELNILDEILFNHSEDYHFMGLIPTKNGLLISNKTANQSEEKYFGLFQLSVK